MAIHHQQLQIRRVLSANIKARRKELGISQEKLAELANLSVQMVNSIEGCRAWLGDKTLVTLAKALGLEVFQLFVPGPAPEERAGDESPALTYWLVKLQKDLKVSLEADIDANFTRFFKAISGTTENR